MIIKKLSLSEFITIKKYGLVVPYNVKAQVSKEYKLVNPHDPEDYVIATCTQNAPVAFKTRAYMDEPDDLDEPDEIIDCSGSLNRTESTSLIKQPKALL